MKAIVNQNLHWPSINHNLPILQGEKVNRVEIRPSTSAADSEETLETFLTKLGSCQVIAKLKVDNTHQRPEFRTYFFLGGGVLTSVFDKLLEFQIENYWFSQEDVNMVKGIISRSQFPSLKKVIIGHSYNDLTWVNHSESWITLEMIAAFQPIRVIWLLGGGENMYLTGGEFETLYKSLKLSQNLEYILNNSIVQFFRYSNNSGQRVEDTLAVYREIHKMKNIKEKFYKIDALKVDIRDIDEWLNYLLQDLKQCTASLF